MRDWLRYVRQRLSLPELTPEREARIVRELAAQLEDFYRDAVAGGASDEDADAYARRQIEDWDRMARAVRVADRPHARPALERRLDRMTDAHATSVHRQPGAVLMFANMIRDARYAVRQLVRTPGFTVVAILTVALAIGASSTMFSVVNGVLLRPLPFPNPERLVRVHEVLQRFGRFSVAPANFLDWRQQTTVFEHIIAYNSSGATLNDNGNAVRLTGALVSWNTFDLLRVAPALGRSFRADEEAAGKDTVIVISHSLWQNRLGGDADVLGRSLNLNGAPVTIVGVMPPDFDFPTGAEFWRPLSFAPNPTRGGHFLAVIARLKPGVAIEQAGAEMKTIAERLAVQYPKQSAGETAEVVFLHDQIVGSIRPALLTLLAAVGVVILIACANVANLLLVRASVREKEIAIRTALGAGRKRLVMQMLAESLVLAFAGGALGVLLAYFAIPPIQTLSAGSIPRAKSISIDATVLAFATGISILTGILFGLAPAWQVSRSSLGSVLKEGGRTSIVSGGRWVRNGLLVAEVAMSIVLLAGAILLLRSFARLTNVDPGFRPEHVLAFRIGLPEATYPEDHNRIAFFDRLIGSLESIPEVASAGMIQALPMRGDYLLSFTIQGRPAAKPNEEPSANHRVVSPHYFKTLGIPLLRGRTFTPQDAQKSPMVAIVDQKFVDRYFPEEDPIGKGIDIGNGTDGFYEIVGVVGNVRQASMDANPEPTMYVPYTQDVFSSMWVVARSNGDPSDLVANARAAVRSIDATLPAYAMTPLPAVISDSLAQRRFSMLLLGTFALLALFLAAVGLYGVVAYTVSQRTQEIGLRMAIGAQRGDVLRMVVGGGMKLAVLGVVIGIASALAMAQVVATMLYEIKPFDPASYTATATILIAVAALACYVPARRATRVDPVVAMRQE
ncbi:MAG TPA: ABC transporter permease [Vicinamibacterales bacterium]|nr:ABC transporter permease [Vicinamibacterales bacterium]